MDNRSTAKLYSFSCDYRKIVEPIFNLSNELAKNLVKNYNLTKLFSKKFIEDIEIRINKEKFDDDLLKELEEEIKIAINRFLVDSSFSSALELKKLERNVLLLSTKHKKLCFFDKTHASNDSDAVKEKAINTLNRAVEECAVIDKIVTGLKYKVVKDVISKVIPLQKFIIYNNKSEVTNSNQIIQTPYILKENIDLTLLNIEDTEFWINRKLFKSQYGIKLSANAIPKEIRDKVTDAVVGFKYDRIIIPLVDFIPYVKSDCIMDYKWLLLKNTYTVEEHRSTSSSNLLKDFKKKKKDPNLNLLLSFLLDNVYIKDNKKSVLMDLKKFFDEAEYIERVKNLDYYKFFVTRNTSKAKNIELGVYSSKKINEKGLNLQQWCNLENGKIVNYNGNISPISTKRNLVYTLKPEISYYFITKYFEDLLLDVFRDLKFEFIDNFRFFKSNNNIAEIDFLVKAEDGKLIFFEAKTKLTKFNIDEYIKRCNKLIPEIEFLYDIKDISFVLISAYSDNTCEDFRFWMRSKNNNSREGLNSKIYDFDVPLAKYPDKEIKCISEPEYDKLKEIVKNICQN